MKEIEPPVSKDLILSELTKDKFVRKTNNANNELYILTALNSPNIMKEIGRLRELSFRKAGGGTGKSLDIDKYDTQDDPYKQLIVWDPSENEILGGYRYHIYNKEIIEKYGAENLATARLFNFSQQFIEDYLPHLMELGRSFVQPAYQTTSRTHKGIYALDNLWDGLGALIIHNPDKKYFFGKVTMYKNYNQRARNLLLYFMNKHFSDKEGLVSPKEPFDTGADIVEMQRIFTGTAYMEDYRILSQKVRAFGENIPPLINAYMSLSPSMRCFGTVINPHFGNVEETALMITINDMYMAKVERHVHNYKPKK